MFTLRKTLISSLLLAIIANIQPTIAMDTKSLVGAAFVSAASIPASIVIIDKFNKNKHGVTQQGFNWLKGAIAGAAGSTSLILLGNALTHHKMDAKTALVPILKATVGGCLMGSLNDVPRDQYGITQLIFFPWTVVPGFALALWAGADLKDAFPE